MFERSKQMTGEEKLAEEYYYKAYPITLSIGEEERKKKVMDIFLAGFKAGRETEREYVKNNAFTSMKEQGLFPFGKWHDLRKDPNDLPKEDCEIITLHENGNKNIQKWKNGNWTNAIVIPVIAWCEIPNFTDKE